MRSALLGLNPRVGRLAVAAAVAFLVLGLTQLGAARADFLPEFMPPSVQVQTEALGLSAAEVEQLITVPLEQDLLNGVPWLETIHSRSAPGLSAIDIVFEQGTDIYQARQMVQERLTQAHALPNVGSPAIMVEPLASMSRVAMVGLRSTSVSLMDMSVLARWKIRPRLMGVPGVANVSIYGLRDRQLQVQVDPQRLSRSDVTLTQVIETAGNALWVSPLTFVEASTPGTGGFIEGQNQRLAVQHVLPITTAQSLGKVAIEGAGTPTRLGDVTEVIEDHQPLIGDAVDAAPTLFLVIQKFPDADTLAVTRDVEEAMASLRPGLGGVTVDTSVYRPASFLDAARRTVGLAGALGIAAVALASVLLFWSWRAALVIASGVTLTAVSTLYLLDLAGATLTTMTLGGLVVVLVLVLGIVAEDVEAVRLALRAPQPVRGAGAPAPGVPASGQADLGQADLGQAVVPRPGLLDVVGEALGRTQRTAVVTLLVGLFALLPLLALDPVGMSLTRPLVVAYLVAAGVAVVVGLVVTPALLVLVVGNRGSAARRPVRAVRWLTEGVARVTSRFATGRALAWSGTALLVLGALAAVPQLDHPALVPQAREANLLLHLQTAPGTSLREMSRVAGLVAADLRETPGVAGVGGHVGRAVTSDQFGDVNAGELWITVSDDADYSATRTAVDQVAAGYPGLRTQLSTYTDDRVSAARTGRDHDLVVRLFGQDLTALGKAGQSVADSLSSVAGVRSAHVVAAPQQPTVRVEVDLAAAERYGLRPGDIRREATTLASGLTVGNLYEQAKVFDVVVLGSPATRANISALADLRVDTPSGAQVRLGDVARVTVAPEQAAIVHEQVMRSLDVVADIRGRDAASVVEDVRRAAAGVPMPAEAHLQVLSSAADQQADTRRLAIVALAALLGILLVLQAVTDGWRRALALLALAPLGGVGAVLAAPAVGGLGTAGPMLAVVATALLTLLGGLAWSTGAGVGAPGSSRPAGPAADELARERVVPVLRTSGLVVPLLVPVILLGERAGAELLRPFAVTALGGVATSTFVVLCLVPALSGPPKGADR